MSIFRELKENGDTITYVSGVVTSDGPEYIEQNLKRLVENTIRIKKLTGSQAFSSGDVFDNEVFDQLEECKLPHEQANELFYRFWQEIVGCGLVDMVCLTPGWERSRGAKGKNIKQHVNVELGYVFLTMGY